MVPLYHPRIQDYFVVGSVDRYYEVPDAGADVLAHRRANHPGASPTEDPHFAFVHTGVSHPSQSCLDSQLAGSCCCFVRMPGINFAG